MPLPCCRKPIINLLYCYSRCKCASEPVDHAIFVQSSDKCYVKFLFVCLECGAVATSDAPLKDMDKLIRGTMGHPKNQWVKQ